MADPYIPLADVIVNPTGSDNAANGGVDRFHVSLSQNTLAFTKANQEKQIVVTNIGWDALNFKEVVLVGTGFSMTELLPDKLLPGKQYSFTITQTATSGNGRVAGAYVDVGDSYGDKYIRITGNIS